MICVTSWELQIFQDSEYNWTHPSTDEWAQRFADVYRENVETSEASSVSDLLDHYE